MAATTQTTVGNPPAWEEAPIATADRRRSLRKPTRAVGKILASDAERHLHGRAVTVADLSLHGVGFQSPQALTIDQQYGLQITGDSMNLSARIRVVSCRQRPDTQWDIGAEFA